MYYKINEDGEKVWCNQINLKLVANSFEKENVENIKNDVLEVLNDKAFDNICWFEEVE